MLVLICIAHSCLLAPLKELGVLAPFLYFCLEKYRRKTPTFVCRERELLVKSCSENTHRKNNYAPTAGTLEEEELNSTHDRHWTLMKAAVHRSWCWFWKSSTSPNRTLTNSIWCLTSVDVENLCVLNPACLLEWGLNVSTSNKTSAGWNNTDRLCSNNER